MEEEQKGYFCCGEREWAARMIKILAMESRAWGLGESKYFKGL